MPNQQRSLSGIRIDVWLILILVLGAYLRLQYVTAPMAEAHSWRQLTNADVSRNYAEESMNLFYPRVSWGGPKDAFVGMEFPLLQWLGAFAFLTSDDPELLLRLIAIAFSLGTIAGVYGLGARLFNRPVGRAAAFLIAISPSAVFFGRTFISDTPMLCLSVLAVWGFAVYVDTGSRRAFVWGTIAAALACLVKVPAVIIFAPIAMLGFEARRWAVVRDVRLLAGIAVALAVTVLWYWHGDNLYHRTGLGQAIWHPSGTYSAEIAVAAGPMKSVSHWATLHQLQDRDFYREMVERLWTLHLTPPGLAIVLVALVAVRRPRRLVVDAWFATVILFILVSAEGNRYHEFHQLPLLPPAALLFGLAAWPVFDAAWLRQHGRGVLAIGAAAIAVTAVALFAFDRSAVVPAFFRPDTLNYRVINAGKAIERHVPQGQLVMTVEYAQYGANSPVLLYRAHRKGWSFDLISITPHVLQRLRVHHGARYFATTIWSELAQKQPDLATFLAAQRRIPLDLDADIALFELQ